MIRILYVETTAYWPSSAHFLEALETRAGRSELQFEFFDEARIAGNDRSIVRRALARVSGVSSFAGELNAALIERSRAFRPTVLLIAKGAWISPATLRRIKREVGALLVNWATDDPFNPVVASDDLVQSISLYDLYLCPRRAMIDDAIRSGCPRAVFVPFGYKPEIHFPECPASDQERARFDCDVAFVGGADRERAAVFAEIVRELPELKLHCYGGYWNRWPRLRRYARGFATGRDFRLALGGSKIAINLVRHANRDDNVMRSFEIPACGAFMLSERTPTHGSIFRDGVDAVLFDSTAELIAKIRIFLDDESRRRAIAASGHERIVGGRHTYSDRLDSILEAVSAFDRFDTSAYTP